MNPEPERPAVTELLGSTGLFNVLDQPTLQAVERELEWIRLPGGTTLFQQGDTGDSLYVLVHGRLSVSIVQQDGQEHPIGEVSRGEIVGEMAVLTGEPRSANVRAIRDSQLVKFSKEAFERVVGSNPKAMMLIARRLIMRLRETSRATYRTTLTTFAVVPLSPDIPLGEFTRRLVEAFSRIGSTVHLNSDVLQKALGGSVNSMHEGRGDERVSAWLEEQDEKFQYVIYESNADNRAWTDLCVRQADRVLLVAAGGTQPRSVTAEDQIQKLCASKTIARKELVFLHLNGTTRPSGTQAWLGSLGAEDTHHHIRHESSADFDRLARILTGNAVGLVLGGGGARGFAHLGIIRAFADVGVPIDMIGGTSMGSVIAAQYALGCDYEEMIELNRKGWLDMDPLKDKTIPVMALLACRKLDSMMEMMFGDAKIEDLWLKYFCVSANLTQAEMMVHRDGPLAKWVRASMAIPGVALPVFDNGDLLVDGGVLNNLPGDVMKRTCGGPVIAVDVSPQKDLAIDPEMIHAPSAWKMLWNNVRPAAEQMHLPNLLALMMRTTMLGSTSKSQEVSRDVDLYLRPPIDGFGIFEWKSLEKLAQAGYEFGRTRLEEWNKERSVPKPKPS